MQFISLETDAGLTVVSLGVKYKKISSQGSSQLSSTTSITKLLRLTQIRRTSLLKLWKGISAHKSLIENTQVNQFVEDYFECCYVPEDPDGYRSDMDEDDDLVAGQISSCARRRNR